MRTSYTSLESDYSTLAQLKDYYAQLSGDVRRLKDLLYSYVSIPEAFPHVLNGDAVRKVATAVRDAGASSSNFWYSMQKIYDYITKNIDYASDIEMPYISTYWYVSYEGREYVTRFYDEIKTVQNYVQTPELSLNIKQGDCDDQAILAYAMIKYYMKYVYGKEYKLYLASIEFSSGKRHLAVILPVEGGELCIMDPAGNYLTKSGGFIASKAALSELQAYSNYWSSDAGSITYMVLYKVNVVDGSYSTFASGTIRQVAAAFG